jgi:AP-1 complex subunit gamma-1
MGSDMNHSNMYAVGLALCTFANISSEEMSRDLSNEIEKLLGSSNTYIRKKVSLIPQMTVLGQADDQAALCALRVIRRVPDLMDNFTSKAKSLLQINNHGVLLAGITLITEMCAADEAICQTFRKVSSILQYDVADNSGNGLTCQAPQITSNDRVQP